MVLDPSIWSNAATSAITVLITWGIPTGARRWRRATDEKKNRESERQTLIGRIAAIRQAFWTNTRLAIKAGVTPDDLADDPEDWWDKHPPSAHSTDADE